MFFVRINLHGVFFDSKPVSSEREAEFLKAEIEKYDVGSVSIEAA